LKFSSTFFLVLGIGEKGASLLGSSQALRGVFENVLGRELRVWSRR
jgi:hypothetical protein